jgi:hypothetical protein
MVSWLGCGEGLGLVIYGELPIWRLGDWSVVIVVNKKRRSFLARALSATMSKPEEEEKSDDQETSDSPYDATCRGGPSELILDKKRTRVRTNNSTNVCSRKSVELISKAWER